MKQRRLLYIITSLAFCVFADLAAKAQVFVKVLVLPPYSSHITDFATHPERVSVTVQNQGNTSMDIQLRGSFRGDNGIILSVNKQYKSSSPVHLAPLETRTLSGTAINALFDYNQLVFSGISKTELLTHGNLPEGNYQICAQAFDYNSNAPLSEDECSNSFPLYNLEPPVIIKPTADDNILPVGATQNFVITWTTPAGAPPSTQYNVRLVEILDNRTPANAIQSSTQPPFFQQTVNGAPALVYGPAQPALTVGRHYALVVQAKDPTNSVIFRNDGMSEVVGFVYGDGNNNPGVLNMQDNAAVSCGCKSALPANTTPSNKNIVMGGTIKAGAFSVTVLGLVKNNDNTITGTGKVNLPVANTSVIPIGVDFTNIQVNSNNELISGSIKAQVKPDVNFLPSIPSPNPSLLPFTTSDVDHLGDYIDNNKQSLISQMKNLAANTVFKLPVGIDKQVAGSPITVEIVAFNITPVQATMDAATIINTPDDAIVSRIALGAKNICVNPTDLCGEAKLFLAEDLVLPSLHITLKGAGNAKGGTYVVFDKDGFKNLQVVGNITLPQNLVVKKADNISPVTAELTANTTKGWSDWMATVTVDPFVMKDNKDFSFALAGDATYDHSDAENPAGLPTMNEKPELAATQWHGFYMPQLNMSLPAVLKNASGQPLTASIQGLVIDGNGVTTKVGITNLLQIGNGSLGGWYYSIDNLGINIINNAFQNGGMDGKLVLPVSESNHQNAQLNYHSTLTNGANGDGIQFQFVMAPKEDLDFAVWAATAQIAQTSNITVTAGGGKDFSAIATLNGKLTIDANLPVVGHVNFAKMQFENFRLLTSNPYIDMGTTTFSLASPQHAIGSNDAVDDDANAKTGAMGDFPVTLQNINPYFADGKLGVKFTMNVKLADIAALPNASTTLSVYGKFKMDNDRPKFYFDAGDAVQLDQVTLDGDLAALHIKGKVDFYHNDATFGNGFKGSVEATFPAVSLGIASTIQFGSVSGFKYWYVDAMADLGQAGVVLGSTGMSIFGLGGGAYYHMKKPALIPDPKNISTKAPSDNPALGASLSGNVYTPDVNTGLGLKATLLFGLNARPTFNSDVTMELAFSSSGGVSMFALDGNARILEIGSGDACVKGGIHVQYDFPNSIMQCTVNSNLAFPPQAPVMTGQFNAAFYFAPKKWYIKFGTPQNKNNVAFFGVLKTLESYMEVGNYQIDPMPPIPDDIQKVLIKSGVSPSFFHRPIDGMVDQGQGFIFGADAGFDYSGSFAIFKASFGAKIGLDVSLKKYSQDDEIICDNGQKTIGADGWYAMGQVYAGIWGSIDISTDFFGDINVLDVGAGAALTAGLPNPTYASGAIGGYYSVLGGAISGHLHFEFTLGSKCTVTKDALSGLKLIGGLTPVDGTKNMEVVTSPAVAFNFDLAQNMYQTFTVKQANGNGGFITRTFRFNSGCVSTSLHDNTHNSNVAVTNYVSEDRTGMTVGPNYGLQRLSSYTFTVSAHLEELIGTNTWVTATYASGKLKGQQFIDTRTITFTTNNGLKSIPEDLVEYTYPLKWQRFFMPDEASTTAYGTGNAVIKTKTALGAGTFDMNGPDQGYKQSFYAKLVPTVGGGGSATTIPFSFASDESGKIAFNLPANYLTANTVYALQFIGRSDPKNSIANIVANSAISLNVLNSQQTTVAGVAKTNAFTVENKLVLYQGMKAGSNSNDTIRSRSLNDMLALKSNELLLYTIYFKTSKYNQFSEKAQEMPIINISYAITGAPGTDAYIMSMAELNSFAASNKSLKAYIANKLLGITDTSVNNKQYSNFSVDYVHDVYMSGTEYFDDYDVNGYNNSGYDNHGQKFAYNVKALLAIDNNATTGWINSFTQTLLKDYGLKFSFNDLNLSYSILAGGIKTSYPVESMDGRNVGNIDSKVVSGAGETAKYLVGTLPRYIVNRRLGMGGVFKSYSTINYTLLTTYRKQVDYQSGGLAVVPVNPIQQYLNIFGGDPVMGFMGRIGLLYDVGLSTAITNNSIQGNVISWGYRLPGTIGAFSPSKTLQIGNISAIKQVSLLR